MSTKKEKTDKSDAAMPNGKSSGTREKAQCFVIMPISDVDGYPEGHFGRVYEYIIKPSCRAAGVDPVRADEVQVTNYIVIDILRRILEADIVICDLSSRNPNVLYELGIRQAFNLPVTLIRDSKTPRIFDIQGLRDIEYDESLRVDRINAAVESLANTLKNTSRLDGGEVNSVIQLLGVKPANVPSLEVSKDTSLLLDALNDIGKRLSSLEDASRRTARIRPIRLNLNKSEKVTTGEVLAYDSAGEVITPGAIVYNRDFGNGIAETYEDGKIIVRFGDSNIAFKVLQGMAEDLRTVY